MKIYQIHCYGGEWEDRFDYIESSYLSEEKAITEKERLEKEDEETMKCSECPLYYCPQDCDCTASNMKECKERAIEYVKKNCKYYKPEETSKYRCEGYHISSYDSCFYKIEEVEVIE